MDHTADPKAPRRLDIAADDLKPVPSLPPLEDSFPSSQKITVGDLGVPFREVCLGGGQPPVRLYDTTGPQGSIPARGLPRVRQPWIDARVARGDGTTRRCTTPGRADHRGDALRRAPRGLHAGVRARRDRRAAARSSPPTSNHPSSSR
jgi:hypothetical protein